MTFNGAEDHYRETKIKISFIIWFSILRSRETKLHWFILSSLSVDNLFPRVDSEVHWSPLPLNQFLTRPNSLAVLTTKTAG